MSQDAPDRTKDLIATLHAARLTGYGDALPGPLEPVFRELSQRYAAADEGGRAAVRAAIPEDLSLLLLGFSDRLATMAARTGDKEMLLDALLSHSIEDFRHDPRENVFRLAVVHHVAKKLGVDPRELFARGSALSSARGAQQLEEFAARPEAMKSLKTMRIREVATPEGVAYEYMD